MSVYCWFCLFDCLPAIFGLAANFKIWLTSEEFANGFANRRIVINDQN